MVCSNVVTHELSYAWEHYSKKLQNNYNLAMMLSIYNLGGKNENKMTKARGTIGPKSEKKEVLKQLVLSE